MAEIVPPSEVNKHPALPEAPSPQEGASPVSNPLDELDVFGPEPEDMPFGNETIRVEPMKMGRIKEFLKVSSGSLPAIAVEVERAHRAGDLSKINMGAILASVDLDQLMSGVAVAVGKTVADMDQMDPAEFVDLAGKVIVVNVDFFVRRLQPALLVAAASIAKVYEKRVVTAGAGTTKSKG